jgi:hypothetical protein
VSRGPGEVQQRILDCLHFGGHFGVPSRELVRVVLKLAAKRVAHCPRDDPLG